MTALKSPISWYGGKYYMAKELINLFPEHKLYCEVFGGAAHVIFKKQVSKIEVYNDIHEGLTTFWRVLRDKEKRNILIEKLAFTPYSRKEFEESKNWEDTMDEVEKARKFYIATMQSRSGNGGWAYSVSYERRNMASTVSKWWSNIDNLDMAIKRFASIQIENLDFEECIKKYDKKSTLFYLDPPYVKETRKQKNSYKHEMTEEDHRKLVNILLKVKGKVILSGYDNEIYKDLEDKGWTKRLLKEVPKSSINHLRNEKKGQEYVWINFIV
jgi:DNA adenine methylase